MCITHISLGRAVARILVIDDDASVRGLLESVLQTDGHEVKVAASAMEGFAMLREARIEMVITDLNMPDTNGLEVVSVVQQDFPATKVIIVSGDTNEYIPLQIEPLRDSIALVPKPFDVSALLGTVHRVLS